MAEVKNEVWCLSGVRCFEENGTAYLHIEDVARGLGFTRITSNGNKRVRWDRVNKYLVQVGFVLTNEHLNNNYYIPENVFYRLCMKAKNKVAKAFQEKIANEIFPYVRKNGIYATDNILEQTFKNPDYVIAVLQKYKFEKEEKELALRQRDEAIRTRDEAVRSKYLFVEGRDAEMTGRVGGLTKANIDLREKNSILSSTNEVLSSENDKLKDEAGIGKTYKQVKNIPWLNQYFKVRESNFYSQCGKVLTKISKEMQIEPIIYEGRDYNIKCYHLSVIDEFKRRLDNGVIFSLLERYYKEKDNSDSCLFRNY